MVKARSTDTSYNGDLLVATLQNKTLDSYDKNLQYLLNYIKNSKADLIVAPELCLTNFNYGNFEEASSFYESAVEALLALIDTQIVVLTMTIKEESFFYNRALVIHKHQILHQQDKHKLFKLGNEEKYFEVGKKNKIKKFKINNITYAILICFELRFKELWKQIEGADVVLIPARWGKSRQTHLEILSRALATMNQCFVLVSNSYDNAMAKASAIISPWGEVYADETLEVIEKNIAIKDVNRVRRLINVE